MYRNFFIISNNAYILFLILKDFVKLFHNCGPELPSKQFIDTFGRFWALFRRFWTLLFRIDILVAFSTLLGASVPNHIEFVALSTLLGASVPNRYLIRRKFDAFGCFSSESILNSSQIRRFWAQQRQSTIEQFDAFGRKLSSK